MTPNGEERRVDARQQQATITGYGATFAECVADADVAADAFYGGAPHTRFNIGAATVHEEHVGQQAEVGTVVARRTFAVTVTYRGA